MLIGEKIKNFIELYMTLHNKYKKVDNCYNIFLINYNTIYTEFAIFIQQIQKEFNLKWKIIDLFLNINNFIINDSYDENKYENGLSSLGI